MTTVDETAKRFASATVNEPRSYTRDNDRTGQRFLNDILRGAIFNDREAKERLSRHQAEERAANPRMAVRSSSGVGTGAFSGLTVPQYLLDMVSLAPANGRPFADAINGHELPDTGQSVNLDRFVSGATAAVQTSELSAVSFTDVNTALLTLPVQTIAGQSLVSRQAVDRGTMVSEVIFQDLLFEYNTTLDSTLLNQASTGLTNIAHNVDFATGSPTPQLAYPKIISAAAQSKAALKRGRPDLVVMNSNRWYWLQEALGVASIFGGPDPATALATYGDGWVGTLPSGQHVILDDNITTAGTADAGTGEDEIYVGPSREAHLFEMPDGPYFIRADQASAINGGVNLVLYSYVAYGFTRVPNAWQKVTGSGLTAVTL